MTDGPQGFVSMKVLREGSPDAQRVLEEIRTIYFTTTKRTIQHDLAHAIELLKTIPTEEEREKARVYMDGLSQMRSAWGEVRKREKRGGREKKR